MDDGYKLEPIRHLVKDGKPVPEAEQVVHAPPVKDLNPQALHWWRLKEKKKADVRVNH